MRIEAEFAPLRIRRAGLDDVPALERLLARSAMALLGAFYSPGQRADLGHYMTVDRALIEDGTFLIGEIGGAVAGCGGWSRRGRLHKPVHPAADAPSPREPTPQRARIRAMFTDPAFARRGVGRAILAAAEAEAAAAGFAAAELLATLAGEPLYRACGWTVLEPTTLPGASGPIPVLRMVKALARWAEQPLGLCG